MPKQPSMTCIQTGFFPKAGVSQIWHTGHSELTPASFQVLWQMMFSHENMTYKKQHLNLLHLFLFFLTRGKLLAVNNQH